jgi:outer membrane biosynthesis protein TonB
VNVRRSFDVPKPVAGALPRRIRPWMTAPSLLCDQPLLEPDDKVAAELIVEADGTKSEVRVLKASSREVGDAALAWLRKCEITPAILDGKPVSVRQPIYLSAAPLPPPVRLGDKISRPTPKSSCGYPQRPAEAIRTTGLVLAEYVVERNGSVYRVELKNESAPAVLYETVRDWLLRCQFEPSKNPAGEAVPVRMIQPFNFGSR